jgi:phosphoglucomutase
MKIHELAGKPVPRSMLANIPRLISAYYAYKPDVSEPGQRVAFGTSGHRGSSLKNSFNEAHILAVSQAICEYRRAQKIRGLFLGWTRTPCLSRPYDRCEVFAANKVDVRVQEGIPIRLRR